jgi:thioester reductase-like protein
LLQETDAEIYCLIRAQSQEEAQARLQMTLSKWNLWRDTFATRLVAIPGDLRMPQLGIHAGTYRVLSGRIDSIYHCATSMNHLETYRMAKPANVDSAGELLRLAVSGRPKVVNHVSTLGIFTAPRADKQRVITEASPTDHEQYRNSQGYLASKWVSDRIFLLAQQRGVPCNVFRLGLVWADTRHGRFDEQQNVYMVLKSCLLSGYAIKNYQYPMPPTPVDYVARAIAYLGQKHPTGQGIFHISSSRQAIQGVFEACNALADRSLELLPHYQWICEMRRLHAEGRSMPAVPLIEYAFDMDEETFLRHESSKRSVVNVHFDLTRTHRELELAGIVSPVLDDELLDVCLRAMTSQDAKLDEATTGRSSAHAASHMGAS